ncbi:MAG: IMP cyclohydrolase [Clostridia bacterium]
MNLICAGAALGATSYPGRGIVAGKSADGKRAILAYFIMGRSENSRNRIFVKDGEALRTQAFDPSKMVDPSLIIYAPVRVVGQSTIVTNGDQTDTICAHLDAGGDFARALRTRTFEPDAPNFTPRVSAMATLSGGDFRLEMALVKASDAAGTRASRFFYEYDSVAPGVGYFLHTYRGDGNPIPAFEGEPEAVEMPDGSAQQIARTLWDSLNQANRVSLWARTIELKSGNVDSAIINSRA